MHFALLRVLISQRIRNPPTQSLSLSPLPSRSSQLYFTKIYPAIFVVFHTKMKMKTSRARGRGRKGGAQETPQTQVEKKSSLSFEFLVIFFVSFFPFLG